MNDERGYTIEYQPLVGTLEKLDVQRVIDETTERWFNRTLCEVDGTAVRLGVLRGEFHWHRHDEQDEFFFVLDGLMRIELGGDADGGAGTARGLHGPKRAPAPTGCASPHGGSDAGTRRRCCHRRLNTPCGHTSG